MRFVKIGTILTLALIVAIISPLQVNAATSMPEKPMESEKFSINAAGATFPFPLIDLWRVEYNKEYSNVNLNYQSIGSGGGIKQHIEKTVNFAASDKALKQKEAELAPKTLHIPEAIGGIVIGYNIPEVPEKGLNLTGEIIADIYLGKITKWNDSAIVEINPGINLPDEGIIAAHRSDGSGTTFVFTDYLSTVSSDFDKFVGAGKSVPWGDVPDSKATLVAAAGNEGVAGIIRSTEYSLGYVELAYAFQTGMSFAFVENADGTAFIEPTLDSISEASSGLADGGLPKAHEDWSGVTMVNAPGPNSYPISSFTYLLVYEDLEKSVDSLEEAKAVIHLIHWMITDGQEHSSKLLYVPLSDKVIEIGKQGLSRVKYEGNQIWDYSGIIKVTEEKQESSDYQLPDWLKNNARWWADGLISDSEYITGLQYLISEGILKV